jgi:hypothetical protein
MTPEETSRGTSVEKAASKRLPLERPSHGGEGERTRRRTQVELLAYPAEGFASHGMAAAAVRCGEMDNNAAAAHVAEASDWVALAHLCLVGQPHHCSALH